MVTNIKPNISLIILVMFFTGCKHNHAQDKEKMDKLKRSAHYTKLECDTIRDLIKEYKVQVLNSQYVVCLFVFDESTYFLSPIANLSECYTAPFTSFTLIDEEIIPIYNSSQENMIPVEYENLLTKRLVSKLNRDVSFPQENYKQLNYIGPMLILDMPTWKFKLNEDGNLIERESKYYHREISEYLHDIRLF